MQPFCFPNKQPASMEVFRYNANDHEFCALRQGSLGHLIVTCTPPFNVQLLMANIASREYRPSRFFEQDLLLLLESANGSSGEVLFKSTTSSSPQLLSLRTDHQISTRLRKREFVVEYLRDCLERVSVYGRKEAEDCYLSLICVARVMERALVDLFIVRLARVLNQSKSTKLMPFLLLIDGLVIATQLLAVADRVYRRPRRCTEYHH